MTIQQFFASGLVCWLLCTLVRCAIDEFRLWRLAQHIEKEGFL